MFRLTREVRFAINDLPDDQLAHPPNNSYAGYPSLTGFGRYFRLEVTLQGELDPRTSYLRNIKRIDQRVREQLGSDRVESELVHVFFPTLRGAFGADLLFSTTLWLSPFLSLTQLALEYPMNTRLSQRFEFCAAHRLHNPALSDVENRKTYGKCNNPNGHGHNYQVQVTLRGEPKRSGLLVEVPLFEKLVHDHLIERWDHKNLNTEIVEFRELLPTVENIAMVAFQTLKNRFTGIGAELASVTVWETSKTWCEYSE